MVKRKKKTWYQYSFEDIYGREWRTDPWLKREQISMTDLYDGSVLGMETEEERYRRDMYKHNARICVRTTISGSQVECDIYPVWGKHDVPRGVKSRESREAQKNLNKKNSQKQLLRYVHGNFTAGDLLLTLSYADYYYPTKAQALKDIKAFLAAIRRARKKAGLPPLKYIYVIEYVSDPEVTKKVRIHHHVIMNAMDRDLAESKWKKGRVNSKIAQPDGNYGLEGFGRYITKTVFSKGEHAWNRSRNLKKPIVHESVTKLTRKGMYDMVHSGDGIGQTMEKMYKNRFDYLDSKVYYSDYVGGFYIYGRLKKKEGVEVVDAVAEKKEERSKDAAIGAIPVRARKDLPHCDIYINVDWRGDPNHPLEKNVGGFAVVNEVSLKNGNKATGEIYEAWANIDKSRLYIRALLAALKRYTVACDITVHCNDTYIWQRLNNRSWCFCTENELAYMRDGDLIEKLQPLLKIHKIRAELEHKNQYTQYELDRLRKKIKNREIETQVDGEDGGDHA